MAELQHPHHHRLSVALAIAMAVVGGWRTSVATAAGLLAPSGSAPAAPKIVAFGPWTVRAPRGPDGFTDWMPAQVPGCVHSDLVRDGKIPDPFYGTNEKALQWIEKTDWEYRSTFAADADLLRRERIEIVFAGLDTYADVSVNGVRVLAADNMFRSWRADIKAQVVAGTNAVVVRFRSPITAVKPAYDRLGYTLPAVNDQSPEMVSMFTRKAPYHYGWDWGPRFVTSGIWRPVSVEAWDRARLDDVQVQQRSLDDAQARLSVSAVVWAARAGRVRVTVGLADGSGLGGVTAPVVAGRNQISTDVVIQRPERWWPNGLGAQRLYPIETALYWEPPADGRGGQGGPPRAEGIEAGLGRRITRIGLRTLEVVSQHDAAGKSFFIKVNGAPVFMKGANWIPSDSFLDRETPERQRSLLQAAATANMNMVRVWGGGVYESDRFYELCDELGLLVWQDFMFACSMYPGDAAFIENVRQETIENVRRLRNHPALALWAGNNEIEAAWQQWGWPWRFHLDKAAQRTIWNDYRHLFHEVIPRVVAAEDPGRFYTRSTPSANEDGVPPGKLGWGDSHYWGVWHAAAPYEDYAANISRFMSEYGFQSFPTLDSVARYAPPSEWRIDSPVMLSHQRHPRGNALVRTYLDRDFHAPRDFGAFLYLSQVLQATVIQFGAEAHRRKMPINMGSLYWQLDDCWPVASWSSIDYYGRWKALQYAARRFFAPVLVSPVDDAGNLRVFVVSDRRSDFGARLTVRLVDFDGHERWHSERDLTVRALTSEPQFSAWKRDLLKGLDPSRVVLSAELRAGGALVGRHLFYFMKTRDLALTPPGLTFVVEPHGETATVRVTAQRLARAVWLTTPSGGSFSDNFFDLLPGETTAVEWTPDPGAPAGGAARLSSLLRAMTVRDTY